MSDKKREKPPSDYFYCSWDTVVMRYINIFCLSVEKERADAGRDGRSRLAGPNSRARTGTRQNVILPVRLTTTDGRTTMLLLLSSHMLFA